MWVRVIAISFCLSTFGFGKCDKVFTEPVGNPGEDQANAQVEEESRKFSVDGREPNSTFPDNEEGGEFTEDSNEKKGNQRFFLKSNTKKEEEEEDEVCYKNLGCFMLGNPWKSVLRPISAPMHPKKIAAFIRFFSRNNLKKEVNITLYPEWDMNGAQFDPEKTTVIMVHGFAASGDSEWLKELKDAYLKQADVNVMVVDWGKGAQLFNYLQVAGNTRLVGRQLENFVKMLIHNYGADPRKFHLIGHSLGAHICAYLAKGVSGISRLTALDPAQPGFEGCDAEVRLANTDADFVDVVHTDAKPFIPTLGFGMIKPVGHVDFYMNGGFSQPGCLIPDLNSIEPIKSIQDLAKIPVEILAKIPSCPHGKAHQYFVEAINSTGNCTFWGHKVNALNVIQSTTNTVTQGFFKNVLRLSDNCTLDTCVPLGLHTNSSPLKGVFLVTTARAKPYCLSEPNTSQENGENDENDEKDENDKNGDSALKKMKKKLLGSIDFNPVSH